MAAFEVIIEAGAGLVAIGDPAGILRVPDEQRAFVERLAVLGVCVNEPHLAIGSGEAAGESLRERTNDLLDEGVEEVEDQGAFRQLVVEHVAVDELLRNVVDMDSLGFE